MIILLYARGNWEVYKESPEWFEFYIYSNESNDGLIYVGY